MACSQTILRCFLLTVTLFEAAFTQSCPSVLNEGRGRALKTEDLESGGWQMVFRGTSGNGHNVHDAWLNGLGTNADKPMTMERSHGLHYRNGIVANWATLGIEYVKFAFYEQDRQVAHIIFNGRKSNIKSWFAKVNVISSSYSDLTSTQAYNYFSIDGHLTKGQYDRRFFVNRSYGGCPKDLGHIAVINTHTPALCNYDAHATYPQFVYSKINSVNHWQRDMYGRADCMAIFIKTAL